MVKLGTKAETLDRLRENLSLAEVLSLIYFTEGQRKENKENIWKNVSDNLPGRHFIVRSSALNEDTANSSQAGKFESVADVSGKEKFFQVVDTVINSFDNRNLGN